MALGTWNPADGSEQLAYRPDPSLIAACATFAQTDDWTGLADWVATHLPADANQMMKAEREAWQPCLVDQNRNTLLALAKFFTVAEQQLPHWHGGDKSPVIWIARHLKQRGEPLDRDTVLWIKAHTDNRFLPNGPIL